MAYGSQTVSAVNIPNHLSPWFSSWVKTTEKNNRKRGYPIKKTQKARLGSFQHRSQHRSVFSALLSPLSLHFLLYLWHESLLCLPCDLIMPMSNCMSWSVPLSWTLCPALPFTLRTAASLDVLQLLPWTRLLPTAGPLHRFWLLPGQPSILCPSYSDHLVNSQSPFTSAPKSLLERSCP